MPVIYLTFVINFKMNKKSLRWKPSFANFNTEMPAGFASIHEVLKENLHWTKGGLSSRLLVFTESIITYCA